MKHTQIGMSAAAGIVCLIVQNLSAAVVTFETVPLGPNSHWDGSDLSGTPGAPGFYGEVPYTQVKQIEGAGFRNTNTPLFGSWSGFAISNHTDTTTPGYGNQYSAITGIGAGGSANYAVGYYATYEETTNVTLASLTNLAGYGASITNTTYTALNMLNGGGGGKKFGGVTGNDADWLLLTISGYANGLATGTSVDFYLADYSPLGTSDDYIVTDWKYVDFTPLGTVDELRFSMTSSDVGKYGINTPTYFALDNLSIPEPSSIWFALSGLGLMIRRKR
ncbi:MAG: DUF4465 domain-containing protein [Gloeobacteraceae cyanobacterium ES-bin-144]|nr:DUF4465 domain-containing protein [Verrucomicrobiales bacterium]